MNPKGAEPKVLLNTRAMSVSCSSPSFTFSIAVVLAMTAIALAIVVSTITDARAMSVRRQNLLDKLAMDLREDLAHLG
jgi:hypothetical protein